MRNFVIGRSSYADIVLADPGIAAYHAELVVTDDGRYYLTDRLSESGTYRRREGEADWTALRQDFVSAGDELRFGSYGCRLEDLLRHVGLLGAEEDAGGGPARGGDNSREAPLRGPVERDPVTGEIVRRRL